MTGQKDWIKVGEGKTSTVEKVARAHIDALEAAKIQTGDQSIDNMINLILDLGKAPSALILFIMAKQQEQLKEKSFSNRSEAGGEPKDGLDSELRSSRVPDPVEKDLLSTTTSSAPDVEFSSSETEQEEKSKSTLPNPFDTRLTRD